MNLKVSNFIKSFDFSKFSLFLKKYKWENEGKYNSIFTIWHRPAREESDCELIVPETNNAYDNNSLLVSLLNNLSDFYKRTPDSIIDEYNNSICDKVKYQIKSNMTKNGMIPLNEGVRLLENAKEMLVSSFMAVKKKKKNYVGQRPDAVNQVLDAIELGQTEEGSFVINIFVPKEYYEKEEDKAPELFEQRESFTRQALNLMGEATNDLLVKINNYQQNKNITIFDDCVNKGLSSNFCNAISEISADGNNDVVISIQYNNGIDKDFSIEDISITKDYIPYIREVAEYYHKDLKEDNYEVKGYVTLLQQEVNATEGEISINAWVEYKPKKVRMHLNESQYQTALQAHKEKAELVCMGTLNIQDRKTKLLDVTSVLIEKSNDDGDEGQDEQ